MKKEIQDGLVEQDVEIGASHGARILMTRYAWIAVISFFLIFFLSLTVRLVGSSWASGQVGGLDGCILTARGNPVAGTVQVGEKSKDIPSDGCFFFKSLKPGDHQISIETVNGRRVEQSVEIISGEAVSLGQIIVR